MFTRTTPATIRNNPSTACQEKIEEVIKSLDQKVKDDVQFSYDRVRSFAEHQLKHLNNDFEVELSPGLFAGQKLITSD